MTVMKTRRYILLLPVFLGGCSLLNEPIVPLEHEVVITASRESDVDNATKTSLSEDGSILWEPADELSFFVNSGDNGGFRLVSTNKEAASTADFVGRINDTDAATYYAIYPYQSKASCVDGVLKTCLPAEQVASENGFSDDLFISVAKSDNFSMRFLNVCGGVVFTVETEGIRQVVFGNRSGAPIAGDVSIVFDENGYPEVSEVENGSDRVTVTAANGGCFEVGKSYYAIMIPASFEEGVSIKYIADFGYAECLSDSSVQIDRSVLSRIPPLDSDLPFLDFTNALISNGLNLYAGVREYITEVNFYTNSTKTTDVVINEGEDYPIYYERKESVANYYTPADRFELPEECDSFFCLPLVTSLDLRSFDFSNVRSMEWFFAHSSSLKEVKLQGINTSNVQSFAYLFHSDSSLETIDATVFDTSSAEDLQYMFYGCEKLKEIDISHFNTSKVTDMNFMFGGCKNLEKLDFSHFDTSNVTNMNSMFWLCRNLRELDLSSFNTSRLTDAGFMFCYCVSLEKLDLASFDLSAISDVSSMCGSFAIHRKHCIVRASENTKSVMTSERAGMPETARDYFVTWILPGESFPENEDPFSDLYKSLDYRKDKTYRKLQSATRGIGLDLVIMGDAYSDRLINDGTYDKDMNRAIDYMFSMNPLRAMRDLFNIYIVYAVSENEQYYGITALDVGYVDETTHMFGGDGISDDYMRAALPRYGWEWQDGRPMPYCVILSNAHEHAGTAFFFTSGATMVLAPLGIDDNDHYLTINHEFGHVVGYLADEYDEYGFTFEPDDKYLDNVENGWYSNIDITDDPEQVKWSRFLNDSRFAEEGLGIFEGGFAKYAKGVWRPTEYSIMRGGTEFNAPSREAIYKWVNKRAFGDTWEYDYETFVSFDLANRTKGSSVSSGLKTGEMLPRLAPPVFVDNGHNPRGASTLVGRVD